MSGEPENQSKFVLSLGFYSHPRLTPINLFALFPEKTWENWKPRARGHQRRTSEFAVLFEETWVKLKEGNN